MPRKYVRKVKVEKKSPMPKSSKSTRARDMEKLNILVPMDLREKVRYLCTKTGYGSSEMVQILLNVAFNHEKEVQKGLYLTVEEASKQVPKAMLEALSAAGAIHSVNNQYPQRQVMRAKALMGKFQKGKL